MDKYEFRRQRLIDLIQEKCNGVGAEMARRIEREPSYVTRMLSAASKPGHKRIAENMVQIIEDAFLIPGWFAMSSTASSPRSQQYDARKEIDDEQDERVVKLTHISRRLADQSLDQLLSYAEHLDAIDNPPKIKRKEQRASRRKSIADHST